MSMGGMCEYRSAGVCVFEKCRTDVCDLCAFCVWYAGHVWVLLTNRSVSVNI